MRGKYVLFLAVAVAPLRAYSLGSLAGMNVSIFRVLVSACSIIVLTQALRQRDASASFFRTATIGGWAFLFLTSVLVTDFVHPADLGSDWNARLMTKAFGIWFVLLVLIGFSTRAWIRVSISGFVFSALIPFGIGSLQWIYFQANQTFPSLPLGGHWLATGSSSADVGTVFWQYARVSSTLGEPNYYGIFAAMVGLVALALAGGQPAGLPLRRRVALWALFGLGMAEAFFTLSLSAAIGFVAGLTALILVSRSTSRIKLLGVVLATTALLAISLTFVSKGSGDVLEAGRFRVSVRASETATLWGRAPFFAAAVSSWSESPLLGVGYQRFAADLKTVGPTPSGHNAFLTVLATQGLFGFIPLVEIGRAHV